MYVYVKSKFPGESLWTVGFYAPDGEWHPASDHTSEADAVWQVHFLNGGSAVRDVGFEERVPGEQPPVPDMSPDARAELHGTEPAAEWEAEQEYCDRAAGRA